MLLTRRHFLSTTLAASLSSVPLSRALGQETNQPLSRIAFGSCAQQWLPQPIWNDIAAQKPDLFLFLGDAIYGDWDGEKVFIPTPETLKRDWDRLAAIPEYAAFKSKVPVLAAWDNHDYGKHDGGAEFALKKESKKLFLDFFDEPADSARRNRIGNYDAKIFGPPGKRVQIILLDTRTFKSPYITDERSAEEKATLGIRGQYLPNTDPNAALLGDAQWQWLEAELDKTAELRLICSSTQVVADEKAMEEWGNFPLERKRLFHLIAKTNASGVILLSGNVHYSEISKTDEGPYPLYDFTSSGLTHTNPAYAELRNKWRVAGPYTEFNFGLVDIKWDAPDSPLVILRAFGLQGTEAIRSQVPLSRLQLDS